MEKVRRQILLLLHSSSAHFLGYGPISDNFSIQFFIFFGTFPGFSKNRGPTMPTCQSRNIASWGLSGAFASVPPRRVSIDDFIFSSYSPTATLIMNSTTSRPEERYHIHMERYDQPESWSGFNIQLQHWIYVKGCQSSQRMLV